MSASKTLMAANGSAVVTGTSGVMAWIAENAPALGIIFTGAMFCVTIIFYTLNYLENRRHNREMEKKDEAT